MTGGCPQGSCYVPGLWIVQYDSLLKEGFPSRSRVVAFADDLLIVVAGKTALESESLGNECMEVVEWCSRNYEVYFNDKKSQVLLVSRRPVGLDFHKEKQRGCWIRFVDLS